MIETGRSISKGGPMRSKPGPKPQRPPPRLGKQEKEDRRKQQLRDAQHRLRQRKLDALNAANSEVDGLKDIIARTAESIKLSLGGCDESSRAVLSNALAQLENIGLGDSSALKHTDSQASPESDRSPEQVFQPIEGLGSSAALYGSPQDASAWSIPDDFSLEPSQGASGDSWGSFPTRPSTSKYSFSIDGTSENSTDSTSAVATPPSNQRVSLTNSPSFGPLLQAIAAGNTSFARHLHRRALELAVQMLSSPETNSSWIERVFGNMLSFVSPSFLVWDITQSLERGCYDGFELFTYPDSKRLPTSIAEMFDDDGQALPTHPYEPKMSCREWNSLSSAMKVNHNTPASVKNEKRLMTPKDVEKFCINYGVMQSPNVDHWGNMDSWSRPFWSAGKLWSVDIDRLVSNLLSVAICAGCGPAFPASDVMKMLTCSMQRVM